MSEHQDFVIPSWLPPSLADWLATQTTFCAEYEKHPEAIRKLLADDRVSVLWSELLKRNPGGYVHPVKKEVLEKRLGTKISFGGDQLQNLALKVLFQQLSRIVAEAPSVPLWSPSERDHHVKQLDQRAQWLLWEALDTEGLGDAWTEIAEGMRHKANLLRMKAEQLRNTKIFVSANKRQNPHGTAAALRAAVALNGLFGLPFYKQSAVIGEIASGSSLSMEQVRKAYNDERRGGVVERSAKLQKNTQMVQG
ncbi:hypothetical protein [Acidisoma sp. 7E03]